MVTGHALVEVSWVTEHTVGWKPCPEGGQVPIREPLDPPHSRWYCECGVVSGAKTGDTKAEAQAKARKAHAEHAKVSDHNDHADCPDVYILNDGSRYCGTCHQPAVESREDRDRRIKRIEKLIEARVQREYAATDDAAIIDSFY